MRLYVSEGGKTEKKPLVISKDNVSVPFFPLSPKTFFVVSLEDVVSQKIKEAVRKQIDTVSIPLSFSHLLKVSKSYGDEIKGMYKFGEKIGYGVARELYENYDKRVFQEMPSIVFYEEGFGSVKFGYQTVKVPVGFLEELGRKFSYRVGDLTTFERFVRDTFGIEYGRALQEIVKGKEKYANLLYISEVKGESNENNTEQYLYLFLFGRGFVNSFNRVSYEMINRYLSEYKNEVRQYLNFFETLIELYRKRVLEWLSEESIYDRLDLFLRKGKLPEGSGNIGKALLAYVFLETVLRSGYMPFVLEKIADTKVIRMGKRSGLIAYRYDFHKIDTYGIDSPLSTAILNIGLVALKRGIGESEKGFLLVKFDKFSVELITNFESISRVKKENIDQTLELATERLAQLLERAILESVRVEQESDDRVSLYLYCPASIPKKTLVRLFGERLVKEAVVKIAEDSSTFREAGYLRGVWAGEYLKAFSSLMDVSSTTFREARGLLTLSEHDPLTLKVEARFSSLDDALKFVSDKHLFRKVVMRKILTGERNAQV